MYLWHINLINLFNLMGISELLKVLRPIIGEAHISEFRDKTAAIDIMAWVYKGVYASAVDIGKGIDSDIYLNFPVKMLAMLRSYGIKCIAVFDGKVPKAKESVIEGRKEHKDKSLEIAHQLLEEGREEESQVHFRRALKIRTKMLNTLIEILKRLKVDVIVAPFEADSQIAYLYKKGLVDFSISEDSDLVPFGVKKVLYKLTPNGYGSYLDLENLKDRDLQSFPCCEAIAKLNPLQLVEVCVMSGCDYMQSFKGLGIKTVLKIFMSFESMERVIYNLKLIKKYQSVIPTDYLEKANKVVGMFFLQMIYDPKDGKLKSLTDLNSASSDEEKKINESLKSKALNEEGFFGESFENYAAYCQGELDLKLLTTEKRLESQDVIKKYINRYAIHFNEYKASINPKKININKSLIKVNTITIANNNIDRCTVTIPAHDEDSNKLHQIQFEEYTQNVENEDMDNLVKENDIELQRFIQDSFTKKTQRKPNLIPPAINFLQEIDKVIKPTTINVIELSDHKPKSLFDLISKEKSATSSPSKLIFSPSVKQPHPTTAKQISECLIKSPFSTQTTINTVPRKYSEINPKALDFGGVAQKKFK
jgi:exonuclease-1